MQLYSPWFHLPGASKCCLHSCGGFLSLLFHSSEQVPSHFVEPNTCLTDKIKSNMKRQKLLLSALSFQNKWTKAMFNCSFLYLKQNTRHAKSCRFAPLLYNSTPTERLGWKSHFIWFIQDIYIYVDAFNLPCQANPCNPGLPSPTVKRGH